MASPIVKEVLDPTRNIGFRVMARYEPRSERKKATHPVHEFVVAEFNGRNYTLWNNPAFIAQLRNLGIVPHNFVVPLGETIFAQAFVDQGVIERFLAHILEVDNLSGKICVKMGARLIMPRISIDCAQTDCRKKSHESALRRLGILSGKLNSDEPLGLELTLDSGAQFVHRQRKKSSQDGGDRNVGRSHSMPSTPHNDSATQDHDMQVEELHRRLLLLRHNSDDEQRRLSNLNSSPDLQVGTGSDDPCQVFDFPSPPNHGASKARSGPTEDPSAMSDDRSADLNFDELSNQGSPHGLKGSTLKHRVTVLADDDLSSACTRTCHCYTQHVHVTGGAVNIVFPHQVIVHNHQVTG